MLEDKDAGWTLLNEVTSGYDFQSKYKDELRSVISKIIPEYKQEEYDEHIVNADDSDTNYFDYFLNDLCYTDEEFIEMVLTEVVNRIFYVRYDCSNDCFEIWEKKNE